MKPRTIIATTLLGLTLTAGTALALDAETQALERAALCQAMPYRTECGGPAPRPTPPVAVQTPIRTRPPQATPSPAPAPTMQAWTEQLCYSYGTYVETIAQGRDRGITLVEHLRLLRIQPAVQGQPWLLAAMEQATIAAYGDLTMTPARLRQMAETICLTELVPSLVRTGASGVHATPQY